MTTALHNLPFRTEHIGSLLRPPELLQACAEHEAGRLSAAELHELEDALIRQAVALQEEIGLWSITDGEYRRGVFYADFICQGLRGARSIMRASACFSSTTPALRSRCRCSRFTSASREPSAPE